MNHIQENAPELQGKPEVSIGEADQIGSEEEVKTNLFADLTDKEIDEIADYNIKEKKTRKQTIW